MTTHHRRTRRRLAAAMIATAVAIAVAGCSSPNSNETAPTAATGGTLTLANVNQDVTFDPAKAKSGGAGVQFWSTVYDTLLTYEPDGTISPNIAESFSMGEDNTVLTMTIREGLTFTDGAPVDAEAVKESLDYNKAGGSARLADIEISAPDESTVVLTSGAPNGLMPTFMTLAEGIVASPASLASADLATNPVGSGPYVLDQSASTSGATYTFTRNEDYWNASAFPYDEVVFQTLTDVNARVSALRSGQVDGALITAQSATSVDDDATTLHESSVNWAGLLFADRAGDIVPALGSVEVRQAINMVFDRDAVLSGLYNDEGGATNQIFNSSNQGYLADMVDYYDFDVAGAQKLMAEAGYEDGFSVDIPVLPGAEVATPIITQQLGLIGIEVNPQPFGSTTVPDMLGGKYAMWYMELESRTALWDIVQSVAPEAVWNPLRSEDPELTSLIDSAQRASEDEIGAVAQEINEFLIKNAWFAPLVLPTNFYATDSNTSATPVLGSNSPYLYTFKPAE
ncbi:ABC transporter substrate-binding protein [Microbacterium marmarense]|uniref:ABC transporter substrate-binding protein n=1 Tax=Microbacterium marmarense TaxID=3122051 RepID=A0ABU8LQZ5_9MICO